MCYIMLFFFLIIFFDIIMLLDFIVDIGDVVNCIDVLVGGNLSVLKMKWLVCMICRKRKLKCDGIKFSCSICFCFGYVC